MRTLINLPAAKAVINIKAKVFVLVKLAEMPAAAQQSGV